MPIISGGGGGGSTFAIPLDVSSTPAGTRLIVDEFGDLIVVGVGGAAAIGVSESPDTTGNAATLSTGQGIRATSLPISVLDAMGNNLGRIEQRGYFVTHANAAPADGDVGNGEVWLWMDETNGVGNTKFMLKGKSADGTVKTAAIVLA